ncbi:DUF445 domain-containing protein [Treponema sp. R6D11]
MKTILLFAVPPVAGAVIGFVTNVIAIRMLFRPLKEIRFFGVRLPFTPGILPKQRHRLAQSIGAMVERELLTPEILRQRLARSDVREQVKNTLSLFTDNFLCKTPNELLEGRENAITQRITGAFENLYPSVTRGFLNFLNRDEIRREMESRGHVFLTKIFLQLNTLQRLFLTVGQYDLTLQEKMPEIIKELVAGIEELLRDGKIRNMLLDTVQVSFEGLIGGQKNISVLFDINPDDKKKLDDFLFEKLMSAVDGQIENILSSINIKALVSERIDSLDMLNVERIILDVMADQFKWIDIFGGILGFLIGAFQAVFSWFLR